MLSSRLVGLTGATGFLGGRLLDKLRARGYRVRCLVRSPSRGAAAAPDGVEVVRGGLEDGAAVAAFAHGLEACFHLASQVGAADPATYDAVNVRGTERLCEALLAHSPRCRLIYASSIAALRVGPLSTGAPAAARRRGGSMLARLTSTPYARSKYRASRRIEQLARERGLDATILYPGMIYGPGDRSFVPYLVGRLRAGTLFLVSGGESGAPLIYVDDLCELFIAASESERARGRGYIAVRGQELGIHGFIAAVAARARLPPPTRVLAKPLLVPIAFAIERAYRLARSSSPPPLTMRAVDVLSLRFAQDHAEATRDLGWRQTTSIDDGLDAAFAWYRANGLLGA